MIQRRVAFVAFAAILALAVVAPTASGSAQATRALTEACRGKPLKRFVHMSSLGVYSYGHHHGTDESVLPPRKHVDGYTQTKVEAERSRVTWSRFDAAAGRGRSRRRARRSGPCSRSSSIR